MHPRSNRSLRRRCWPGSGPHIELWTAQYHREAVSVHGKSLPSAAEFGYSRTSLYRELSKLWKTLGVSDRAYAIRKAAQAGLLD